MRFNHLFSLKSLLTGRNYFPVFLALWLIINLAQALFTGLFHDETYYFFYSRHLAWGYYDHPPLIALLIRSGYVVFNNELGIRLFYVLLSLGTILVVYRLSAVKNEILFAVMVFSFMIFQVIGFLAIPDSLLLFFTALFFLVYKKYREKQDYRRAVWLGLVMAGMLYSKYLGVMIIFFTVISDLKLLRSRSFWLSVLVTSVLFVPHLFWQYGHDFPSVYYHLLERSHDEVFRWNNFGDFIAGQFLQVNPLLFIPVIYFLIIFKAKDPYEKALKYSAAGSLILPLFLMIKGRVEANWSMAGLLPLFLIAFRLSEERPKFHRFIYISGAISLVLVILIRVLLVVNFLPAPYNKMIKVDVYGWDAFMDKVSDLAVDRPVVFIGSYQNPSRYIFHTGKVAFAFNDVSYRSNQFDLENIERKILGKEALLIFPKKSIELDDFLEYGIGQSDSIQYPNGKYRYYVFKENYRTYNFIPVDILLDNLTVKAGTSIDIPVRMRNPGDSPVKFSEGDTIGTFLTSYLIQYGKPVDYHRFEDISSLVLVDEYRTSFILQAPDKPGVYYLRVSLKNGWLPPGINGRLIKVRVE